ncbi:HlyD family efflux transporter periplasmic adaptor subunit [Erwinia sp. CPCC 100877]|nr:HlyD family efflux transporter periplasmic adaptor subunit [Erwinia sp. CPCC 100877]
MSLFRQESIEGVKRPRLGEVILAPRPSLRISGMISLAVLLALIAFIAFFSYTREQKVSGILLPEQGVIKIYSPQAGVVKKIYVKEGDGVKVGDPLFVITGDRSSFEHDSTQESISDQIRTKLKLYNDSLRDLDSSWKLNKENYQSQIQQLKLRIELQKKQVSNQEKLARLLKQRVSQYQDLANKKFVSLEQLQRVNEESLRQNSNLATSQGELINARNLLLQHISTLAQLENDYERKSSDIKSNIASARQELIESELKKEIIIRSSKEGEITALTVTEGQYFDGHAPLLSIIPSGSQLVAYLYAPGTSIGFIKPDSDVWIRYSAWPWQKFGQHHGKVVNVSSVGLTKNEIEFPDNEMSDGPFYRIVVRPDENFIHVYGKKEKLKAGMRLESNVTLDSRRLYEWIFEPLLNIKGKD